MNVCGTRAEAQGRRSPRAGAGPAESRWVGSLHGGLCSGFRRFLSLRSIRNAGRRSECVCVCARACVCVHACVCARACVCTHACVCTCACVHCVCARVYTRVCTLASPVPWSLAMCVSNCILLLHVFFPHFCFLTCPFCVTRHTSRPLDWQCQHLETRKEVPVAPGRGAAGRAHPSGPLRAPSPSRPPPGASSAAHAASPSANARARSGPGPLCSGFVPAAAAQRWGWLSNCRASSRLLRCIYLMPGLQNKCMSPRHSFSPATYFHGGQKKKKVFSSVVDP